MTMRETLDLIWPKYLQHYGETHRRRIYNETLTLMANGTPARQALARALKNYRKSI